MAQSVYISDDDASVAMLLRRAQWYRDYAERSGNSLWDERLRAADYLEAEAVRRTNPSFYRPVTSH